MSLCQFLIRAVVLSFAGQLSGIRRIHAPLFCFLLHRVGDTKAAQAILSDYTHPLYAEYKLLPSGRRYALPRCRIIRPKNSFVPTTTGFLNSVTRLVLFQCIFVSEDGVFLITFTLAFSFWEAKVGFPNLDRGLFQKWSYDDMHKEKSRILKKTRSLLKP